MNLYKDAYIKLFQGVTKAIETGEKGECRQCVQLLIKAQRECEDIFINAEPENNITLLKQ